MKYFAVSILLAAASTAFGSGFVCVEDKRPVEGVYREVRLVESEGGYDLIQKTIGAWDPVADEKVLATDLNCNFSKRDARLAYCFRAKTGSEEGNSFIYAKRMDLTQVTALEKAGEVSKRSYFVADVSSPQAGSQKEIRFLWNDCDAIGAH